MNTQSTTGSRQFGPIHILDPQTAHTHTMIMLHGRGSNGPEYAEEFIASHSSDGKSLVDKLPGWRWVFPSSQELWSTAFQEVMPAWFEAHSLTDITVRQNLQISGIQESVKYVQGLIDLEIAKLGGQADNVFLGGISQGGAIGLWTLLCGGPVSGIGAFLGASTWLPFATNMEKLLGSPSSMGENVAEADAKVDEYDSFVRSMAMDFKQELVHRSSGRRLPKIFLGHGEDDAYVDVTLGTQARDVLARVGFVVEWKEYSGAEEEGHWFKVPNEMDDMYQFIRNIMLLVRNETG